jgi:hypothetical protein
MDMNFEIVNKSTPYNNNRSMPLFPKNKHSHPHPHPQPQRIKERSNNNSKAVYDNNNNNSFQQVADKLGYDYNSYKESPHSSSLMSTENELKVIRTLETAHNVDFLTYSYINKVSFFIYYLVFI